VLRVLTTDYRIKRIVAFFTLISAPLVTHAQVDTIKPFSDSTTVVPIIAVDTTAKFPKAIIGYQPAKRPWVAVGFSAALPGAGQIYNETYWKVPIIWGLGGYWIYEWTQQNNKYQDYRQQYSASITPQLPNGNSRYLQLRDFYRNERDSYAWYLGALYFLNLVDAYVGANLYDFDVGPDLTADGKIVPKVTATMRVKF
jgi:hypothetical protein